MQRIFPDPGLIQVSEVAIKKIIQASQRMINEQNNKSKIVEMLTNNKKKKYDVREYFGTEEEWKEDTEEGGKDEDGNKNFFERAGHCALKQLAYCNEHEILWDKWWWEGCPLCGIHDIITSHYTCEEQVKRDEEVARH